MRFVFCHMILISWFHPLWSRSCSFASDIYCNIDSQLCFGVNISSNPPIICYIKYFYRKIKTLDEKAKKGLLLKSKSSIEEYKKTLGDVFQIQYKDVSRRYKVINYKVIHSRIRLFIKGGGGVQAYNFRKFDFEKWVEGEGHLFLSSQTTPRRWKWTSDWLPKRPAKSSGGYAKWARGWQFGRLWKSFPLNDLRKFFRIITFLSRI